MAEGLTGDLIFAAFAVGVFGFLVARRDLPLFFALLVAVVKVLFPLIYFAWYYDGVWSFIDDKTYQRNGALLLAYGYNPFTIFFQPKGMLALFSHSGGIHFLYLWWNLLGEYLFGAHYYSPVFLNVGLTFIAGSFLYRICLLAGFKKPYAQGLLVFFLLHWDILAWSSITNLKDILVLTLALAALYFLIRLAILPEQNRPKWVNILWLGAILFVMIWVRFYLPLLFALTFGIWTLFKRGDRRKYLVLAVILSAVFVLLPRIAPVLDIAQSGASRSRLTLRPAGLAVSIIRTALTPQPWQIDSPYSFLFIPAVIHWILLLPALLASYALWRRSPVVAFMLLYWAVAMLFYSVVVELQGPRQRTQLTFMYAWMQYHAFYLFLRMEIRLPQRETVPRPSPEV